MRVQRRNRLSCDADAVSRAEGSIPIAPRRLIYWYVSFSRILRYNRRRLLDLALCKILNHPEIYDVLIVAKPSARNPRIAGGGDPADSVWVLIQMSGYLWRNLT